jgi:hypothetical protein
VTIIASKINGSNEVKLTIFILNAISNYELYGIGGTRILFNYNCLI